jgi:predicted DNA-binding transcriptional regulator YafY
VPHSPRWLEPDQALKLFQCAETVPDQMPSGLKQQQMENLLRELPALEPELDRMADQRAQALSHSHKRVRQITKEGSVGIYPQRSRDLLGVYILNPSKRG